MGILKIDTKKMHYIIYYYSRYIKISYCIYKSVMCSRNALAVYLIESDFSTKALLLKQFPYQRSENDYKLLSLIETVVMHFDNII